MIRSILLLVVLMPACLACQKGGEKSEQAQSTFKVFAGDKSVLVRKEMVESTTADLVALMRRNLVHFDKVFGTVREGMDRCRETAEELKAYLDKSVEDDKKLFMRLRKMETELTQEEMKRVGELGSQTLLDEMQAFEKTLPANMELLREFRRKCPKEAETVREVMQRFLQRVFK
jgi:hypothetical protein